MAMPMAFHSARKVRENLNKPMVTVSVTQQHGQQESAGFDWNAKFKSFEEQGSLLARRYNEKMMNAIWGLYNRKSAHNFKSRADGSDGPFLAASQAAVMSFDSVAYQISRITPGLVNCFCEGGQQQDK